MEQNHISATTPIIDHATYLPLDSAP